MLHPESESLPISPLLFIVQLPPLRSENWPISPLSVWCLPLKGDAHTCTEKPTALLPLPSKAMSEWLCAPQAPDSRTYPHGSISKSHNVGYCCFWSNVKEKAIWMERNSRHLMCSGRLSYSIMPQDCKPSKRCFFTWLPHYSLKCYGKQPQNCPFKR